MSTYLRPQLEAFKVRVQNIQLSLLNAPLKKSRAIYCESNEHMENNATRFKQQLTVLGLLHLVKIMKSTNVRY